MDKVVNEVLKGEVVSLDAGQNHFYMDVYGEDDDLTIQEILADFEGKRVWMRIEIGEMVR